MRLGDLGALHDIVWEWTKDEDADHEQIGCFDVFLAQIEDAPTVEAAPVVHGKWEDSEEHKGWQTCSACHGCYVDKEWVDGKKWRYCPNCAAKMDL